MHAGARMVGLLFTTWCTAVLLHPHAVALSGTRGNLGLLAWAAAFRDCCMQVRCKNARMQVHVEALL